MTLQERLKIIRKDAGLSQHEMAERLHVSSYVVVSGWETGRTVIGKTRLYQIAEEFNVNIDWLLTGEGPQYKSPAIVSDEAKRKIEDETLLKLFLSLPIEFQERIIEVLRENVKQQGNTPRNVVNNNGTINGNINQGTQNE